MKYVPPFGVSDPNAPYVNGDPTIGRQGSIPPAAVFENPQREILNVIDKSRIVPSDADLQQLLKSVRSQFLNYAEDRSTTENLITAVFDPPLGPYTPGLTLRVRIRNRNTGPVRINAGSGTVPVRKMNGTELSDGELDIGSIVTMVYDGLSGIFQTSNFAGAGSGGTITNQFINIPYTRDSGTPNHVVARFLPPHAPLVAGAIMAVRILHTNTGPSTIQVEDFPPVVLKPNGGYGLDTIHGDIKTGDVVLFLYDGEYFWFAPNPEITGYAYYNIGPGSGDDFPSIAHAMNALHRKTIGATGYVELRMAAGNWTPISLSHPSADRILIRGTMRGGSFPAREGDYRTSGASDQARASDAVANRDMLLAKYGTVIYSQPGTPGIMNYGPGLPHFDQLLVMGPEPRLPFVSYYDAAYGGCQTQVGSKLVLMNSAIHGTQFGTNDSGNSVYVNVYCSAQTRRGFAVGSGLSHFHSCHAFGIGFHSAELPSGEHVGEAFYAEAAGGIATGFCSARMNVHGFVATGSSLGTLWWSRFVGNRDTDIYVVQNSTASLIYGHGMTNAAFGVSTPPPFTVGNANSYFAWHEAAPFTSPDTNPWP